MTTPAVDHAALTQMTATHCCVCRANLTDAESVQHGIGPICSKRYYNPLHEPTDHQVKEALGLLAVSGLPDHIIDGFVGLVNNNKVEARLGSNLLVYWASCHYDNREEVFRCSAIIRSLGYDDLADKLEIDRTEARIKDNGDGTVTVYAGTKKRFTLDMDKIPGVIRVDGDKIGSKQRWNFPKAGMDHFLCLLGVHYPYKLACGDLLPDGLRVWNIKKKYWRDLRVFRNYCQPPLSPQAPPGVPQSPPSGLPSGGVALVVSGGWVAVYTPYNDPFKSDLKAQIPYKDREWTGTCWRVKAAHIDTLIHLMRQHFGQDFNAP